MNKKVILSIVAVLLCLVLVGVGVMVSNNKQPAEGQGDNQGESFVSEQDNSTSDYQNDVTDNFVEESTDEKNENIADNREESTSDKRGQTVTGNTNENSTETVTKVESITGESSLQPKAVNNKYKLIYNGNGEISQIKIDVAGKYDSTKIKNADTVYVSVDLDYIKVGTSEYYGKYKGQYYESYNWDFNLATKQGRCEQSSCAEVKYENGEVVNADGFPEQQAPYNNAVELDFKEDCVTVTVTLDKPVDVKGKNIEVYINIDEKTFTTYEGYNNEFWAVTYRETITQPDIDITTTMLTAEPVTEDTFEETVIYEEPGTTAPQIDELEPTTEEIVPIACE